MNNEHQEIFGDDLHELALCACEQLGGRYAPDYVSQNEADELYKNIENGVWVDDIKRRIQQYGYCYDYRARKIDESMKLGALPEWVRPLGERLQQEFFNGQYPQQLIVNEYEIGQGITAHIDAECFGPVIVSVSLCAPAYMEFAPRDAAAGKAKFKILLSPRSAIVLAGDLRARWTHSLWLRKKDVAGEYNRRISLTFRTVADD